MPHSSVSPRPLRRLAAVLLSLPLLLCLLAPAVHADDNPLDQTVDPMEKNVDGRAVLDAGHVDIGPRFIDGTWRIQGRDDSQSPPVWRSLTDVVTQVKDAATQKAPDSPDFSFLNAQPGTDLFVIPQTQAPEVVWLGWNTQDPDVMERVSRGVTLTMHSVKGPGHFSVFLQNGDLGAPDVLWDGDGKGAQDLWVDLNTHTHANWVFTEPGVYVVDFEVSADLVTGERVSDRAPLRFAVGEQTDIDAAFDAVAEHKDAPTAAATSTARGIEKDGQAAKEPTSSSLPVALIAVLAGAVVLLAGVSAAGVRARRARRIADADGHVAEGPGRNEEGTP